jgi:phospholipase C
LASGAAAMDALSGTIDRALAIDPAPGSSYLDAKHVVILMQENRSFDHTFGTLRGVRGFNDPRAITLPDGNPVWVQSSAAGERYVPFRLDMKDSRATWMGCLPHGRSDQVDARNNGLHDRWLPSKKSGNADYAAIPLTLGYYTRADIPFYYGLADAFTICDQNFCSCLGPTTPNRLHLWSGTIRERPRPDAPANVRNEDVDLDHLANWTTFPERLQDLGITWRIYQNELTVESGLSEEEDAWLANFGDNPLEYFEQFDVRWAAPHRRFVERRLEEIPGEIATLQERLSSSSGGAVARANLEKRIAELSATLKAFQTERKIQKVKSGNAVLSDRMKALHERAFSVNSADPCYRQLAELSYHDGDQERQMRVPKGDVLHQFRCDVDNGNLPAVSWLVSPERYSDHPSSAWFGAWYLAEAMNILTRNPEVWKKTIFILTYDENDGYFDHVPPFVPPHPERPESGKVTKGIDPAVEYVELEQDLRRVPAAEAREGPIGLGYRVPMIIASPWSRGGCVCSQVFDHTSILRLLEKVLTHQLNRKVEEPNISRWRRAICGDLTAAFRPADAAPGVALEFPQQAAFHEAIHRAQFKELPRGYRPLSQGETLQIHSKGAASGLLPNQEPGVRPSCPLPYELAVNGALNDARTHFIIRFEARKRLFGDRAAGAPFVVYSLAPNGRRRVRNYAVEASEHLEDSWELKRFPDGSYHLQAHGPNGFFREFRGSPSNPALEVQFDYALARPAVRDLTGDIEIVGVNKEKHRTHTVQVVDNAYGIPPSVHVLSPGASATTLVSTRRSLGWYDISVRTLSSPFFEQRYAGRVETGKWSSSDPAMGRISG